MAASAQSQNRIEEDMQEDERSFFSRDSKKNLWNMPWEYVLAGIVVLLVAILVPIFIHPESDKEVHQAHVLITEGKIEYNSTL